MSRSSRRNFNQRLGQLLLSTAVPPAAIQQCQAESWKRAFSQNNIN
ncbi:hypothetical protein [Microcoleus sp. C2D2]